MKHLFQVILFFCTYASFSQSTYQINGTVKDANDKAIDLTMVSLYHYTDSSFVKSEFTDQDGSFLLSNINEGKYIIRLKQLGFLDYTDTIEVNQNLELPDIKLETNETVLDKVTVQANVPFVVRKIDRTVINPEAMIANAGSNALEVLERAPGVSVDPNGAILLKGRSGVQVFINDKPSYLSGSELENYLKSLPAGSIKTIEIMENPPAKYEAAGNSGIINIKLKRGSVKGLYGNTAVSYRRSRYNGSNNSFNLNYNKNKVSLYTNVYAGFWESFQDLNINRYYLDEDDALQSSFAQNSFNHNKGKYLDGRIGLDLYPTDKATFGFSYKRSTSPGERSVDNTSLVSNANGNLLQRVVADNLSETGFRNNLVNAYFRKDLDTLGSAISFDADYVQYKSTNDQTFQNFQYDATDLLIYQDQINGEIPSEINIAAVKADYTKPIKAKSKLDLGLKSAFTKTDNEAIYSTTIDDETNPNYDLSNRFIYDEWINAAYLNFGTTLGKVGLQFGLRGEVTHLEGNQLGNIEKPDTSFSRTYGSLFPTFYAQTALDSLGKHGLNFSYGRRVDRPYFQDLNPFISPLDKFTFYTGNPNLLPTFSHNLSLTYSYNNKINTSLSYSITTNGIRETLEIQDGIYYSRPGNIATSQYLALSVDASLPITKWYSINAYAEAAYVQFDSQLYTEQLNSSGINVYTQASNIFRFKKGWRMDISGRYMTDQVASQLLIRGYAMVSMGIQKVILDGKGSIKLSANDLFYTQRGDGVINNLHQTEADWNSKYDSRSITATFSLRFGKTGSTKKKYNSSGSDSEQRRVRG